jgi:hypothetical protein
MTSGADNLPWGSTDRLGTSTPSYLQQEVQPK